jgi:hypothetical protein
MAVAVRRSIVIDSLESRQLMAVSTDASGWTVVTPSRDSRVIYVSSSQGRDTNAGTQSSPVASLGRARSMIRAGMPDHILLRRGDVFSGSIWLGSGGRNAQEPLYIGAYGTGPRPLINTGVNEGVMTVGGTGRSASNIVVQGIAFNANTFNGRNGGWNTTGIRINAAGSNILLEDNFIRGFKDNISVDAIGGTFTGLRVRRNVIVDSYNISSANGHSQGLYAGGSTRNLLIEGNIFDNNGWRAGVSSPTMFNHAIYINTGAQGSVIRNNIVTRSSMRGILSRGGAVVEGNVLARNAVGIEVGNGASTVRNNVVMEGTDLPNQELSVGMQAFNISNLQVSGNIFANAIGQGPWNIAAIKLQSGISGGSISGNKVFSWKGGISLNGQRISSSGNDVQASPAAGRNVSRTNLRTTFTDPTRNLGRYAQSLGKGTTLESFVSAARNLGRSNYDTRFTAGAVAGYIRGGFNYGTSRLAPMITTAVISPWGGSTLFSVDRINSNPNLALFV